MKEEYVTFDIETPIYVGDDLSHKKAVNGTLFFGHQTRVFIQRKVSSFCKDDVDACVIAKKCA